MPLLQSVLKPSSNYSGQHARSAPHNAVNWRTGALCCCVRDYKRPE